MYRPGRTISRRAFSCQFARQTALPGDILNKEGCLRSTMKNGESEESKVKVGVWEMVDRLIHRLNLMENRHEGRIIALERGLEGVLNKMEASGQADDEAGWYGRPE